MNADYKMCSEGKNQSPINLGDFIEADLSSITFKYTAGATEILNNVHAVQVNYAGGSTITVNSHEFELMQFHSHAPSENQINGKSYAMEAHYVHADKAGNVAVVAVMLEEGAANDLNGKPTK